MKHFKNKKERKRERERAKKNYDAINNPKKKKIHQHVTLD
jgi:hypothetical protein